jgi:hypothetical protein
MSRETFCTIITYSHLHYAYALNETLMEHGNASLCVLVVDCSPSELPAPSGQNNITFFTKEQAAQTDHFDIIFKKYYRENLDKFRWCMKPVFMIYLLNKLNLRKIIYIDPDCMIFDKYGFLFDELDNANILLSPHWRSMNPYKDSGNFSTNFTDGLYNGGFVGASINGQDALSWWAQACGYKCEKEPCNGFFDDQRYLDFLQSRFERVHALRHKGCNIAAWNIVDCKRTPDSTGKILINEKWPIVFIHFTASTMRAILSGRDKHLLHYLEKQNKLLKQFNPKQDDLTQLEARYTPDDKSEKYSSPSLINRFKDLITNKIKM